MLLRQLELFCAVAREMSFTRAAETCNISQSAISQQVKALEKDLGCQLVERRGRSFALTPAGAHLAQGGRTLLEAAEALRYEVEDIAYGRPHTLRIGYLNRYEGWEVAAAVAAFTRRHPHIDTQVSADSHEGLYHGMLDGTYDLAFNNRRRSLSPEFNNVHLVRSWGYIVASEGSRLSTRSSVSARDLAGETCILVCPPEQEPAERTYYRDQLGYPCDFTRADTLEQARFMVAGNKGLLPIGTRNEHEDPGTVLRRIPMMAPAGEGPDHDRLVHDHSDYYAFWPRAREHPYAGDFSEILRELFA